MGVAADDYFHDECAVVGVWGHPEAANHCYLALYAMQHRGQEGAGIVSCDGKVMHCYKEMGLVADVFEPDTLAKLKGSTAIGHTRYATYGSKDWQNLQPFVANLTENSFALAHNGNLTNSLDLRRDLELQGAIFSSTSDTEVFLHLIARQGQSASFVDKLSAALRLVRGAYSLVVLHGKSLYAVRDPYGVRPLSIASLGSGYAVASETCAFDLIGAEFQREVKPGEILEITETGELKSHTFAFAGDPALCIFEYIYFSRPDSNLDGLNVYDVRKRFGAELARQHPVSADLVVPVPDSGVPAAIGFAQAMNLPMELGLIRNHYVGRTFIEPKQSIRDFGVKIKLNPNSNLLRDKRVVLVDDSIVRGTTSRKIVKMLRAAGAKEVHFRVSSPPTSGPCYYGIDTPSKDELIASSHSVEEIRDYIGADSLGYLSVEGMYSAIGRKRCGYCDACFSGNYRLGIIGDCSSGGPGKQVDRVEEPRRENSRSMASVSLA